MRVANDLIILTKQGSTITIMLISRTFLIKEKISKVRIELKNYIIKSKNCFEKK